VEVYKERKTDAAGREWYIDQLGYDYRKKRC